MPQTAVGSREFAIFHNKIHILKEGLEVPAVFTDDTPAGKIWTQQWRIRRLGGKPGIVGVIYDGFGNGIEREFVRVTVPANARISEIADRMPLILGDEGLPAWLDELVGRG